MPEVILTPVRPSAALKLPDGLGDRRRRPARIDELMGQLHVADADLLADRLDQIVRLGKAIDQRIGVERQREGQGRTPDYQRNFGRMKSGRGAVLGKEFSALRVRGDAPESRWSPAPSRGRRSPPRRCRARCCRRLRRRATDPDGRESRARNRRCRQMAFRSSAPCRRALRKARRSARRRRPCRSLVSITLSGLVQRHGTPRRAAGRQQRLVVRKRHGHRPRSQPAARSRHPHRSSVRSRSSPVSGDRSPSRLTSRHFVAQRHRSPARLPRFRICQATSPEVRNQSQLPPRRNRDRRDGGRFPPSACRNSRG